MTERESTAAGAVAPAALLSALLLGACTPPASTPTVEYTGCLAVSPDAVCVIEADAELRLWVRAPTDALIEIDGLANPVTSTTVLDGRRFEVRPKASAHRLVVRVAHGDRTGQWRLRLTRRQRPQWYRQALAERRADTTAAAKELLEVKTSSTDPLDRALAHRLLAGDAFRSGDHERLRHHQHEAARASREAGDYRLLVRSLTAVTWSLMQQGRFAEADGLLGDLPTGWRAPADSHYAMHYFRGLLAFNVGDTRVALRELTAASEQAQRLLTTQNRADADSILAIQLQRIGRHEEAAARLQRLLDNASDLSPCTRASLLTNLGWSRLLLLEAGEPAENPASLFAQAQALSAQGSCGFGSEHEANLTINLALALYHDGAIDDAEQSLNDAVASASVSPRIGFWREYLAARLALERNDTQRALEIYTKLAAAPENIGVPSAAWRIATGQAQTFESNGNAIKALQHYSRAEAMLDDTVIDVPLAAGRASLLAQRRLVTRRHLALLLDRREYSQAFELSRHSRARVLRGLQCEAGVSGLSGEQRTRRLDAISEYEQTRAAIGRTLARRATAPLDEARRLDVELSRLAVEARDALDRGFAHCGQTLRQPVSPAMRQPGELLVAYHPLPQGWVGFALDDSGLTTQRLGCVAEAHSPGAQSACLLEPFGDKLNQARRVRVLSLGFLNRVDFHALDAVRRAARPVTYSLDVGQSPTRTTVIRRALIVADPRGDLPAARQEAALVASALQAAGVARVEVLTGHDADATSVRNRLPQADLLHYAGHATYSGRGGWESVLSLAGDSELTVADIFAAAGVPRIVVLSGCDAARVSPEDGPESLGLAQAFVASGAGAVVAAVRPVEDDFARDLVASLYANWPESGDLAGALYRAQRELSAAADAVDWAAYRLIEP